MILLILWMVLRLGALVAAEPVLQTGVADATKDKPQSKLWFAQGTWWGWLPTTDGSAVWKRTAQGWRRQNALDGALRGLPGQADVWADAKEAAAVLVEKQRLGFVRLRFAGGSYVVVGKPVVFTLSAEHKTETATLVRDDQRRWWIAYDHGRRMFVRASSDESGERWLEPIEVSTQKTDTDDICSIAALPGGVGVIWSDQASDTVWFRFHSSRQGVTKWNPVEVVAQGNRTADDHFHSALAADGTLFVATKNSLDTMGQPQLVLRVRDATGKWSNYPYALRTTGGEPSRPIALVGGGRLHLLHSVYRRKGLGSVVVGFSTAVKPLVLDGGAEVLIEGASGVNNVTGSKAALPEGAEWVVLASDGKGGVYEGVVR
ncbi:MAG: hypothetical protein JST93_25320 [Acidobacteria bacterium]|nr:hypothetical protein [Acidobacteriota bacterium]